MSLLFYVALLPVHADSPTVFTNALTTPAGITTDQDGNIYVASDNLNSARLTKFGPDGALIWTQTYGNFSSVFAGQALVTDPTTGLIWNLWSTGEVYLVDPNTGGQTFAFSVKQFALDTTDIYQLENLQPDPTILIDLQESFFVDIALLRRNDGTLDVFLTANYFNLPYIMRLRIPPNGSIAAIEAKALVYSIVTAGFRNEMGGIGVNDQWVLTMLYRLRPDVVIQNDIEPIPRSYQIPVVFSPNFPEDQSDLSTPRILEGQHLNTRGITTDAAGNFYMTTGTLGFSNQLCDPRNDNALIIISADIRRYSCHSLGFEYVNTRKVAVTQPGNFVYLTEIPSPGLTNRNIVWKFTFPTGPVFTNSFVPYEVYLPVILR